MKGRCGDGVGVGGGSGGGGGARVKAKYEVEQGRAREWRRERVDGKRGKSGNKAEGGE